MPPKGPDTGRPSSAADRLRSGALAGARRLLRGLSVVVLVTMAVVALLQFIPGSAAQAILGDQATAANVSALNERLGLDQPVWNQYLNWVGAALHGDLGRSALSDRPVVASILTAVPVTLELAALAIVVALGLALPMALVSAVRQGRTVDRVLNGISSAMLSMPAFVVGPILIYLLAVKANIFPVIGWSWLADGLLANLRSAALPAIAIALCEVAALHRVLRADLIATLGEDFVTAARAKGLSSTYVLLRHALRPSSFSLVTLAGVSFGRLIGGTVIVESLFSLPGLGQLVVTAIFSRDLVVVQGVVAFTALMYVLLNSVVDAAYPLLDPRVRMARRA